MLHRIFGQRDVAFVHRVERPEIEQHAFHGSAGDEVVEDRANPVDGFVEPVVDHHMVELGCLGQFEFGFGHPAVDDLGGVGAAVLEPAAQFFDRGGDEEAMMWPFCQMRSISLRSVP